MPDRKINYAALSYANQWWGTDYDLLEKMKEKDRYVLQKHIREISSVYQVARTFHAKDATEVTREALWKKVTSAVVKFRDSKNIPAVASVESLAKTMGNIFNRPPLISAASKFLWFSGHFDVRIYDSRAVRTLIPKYGSELNGNYEAFVAAWDSEYKAVKSQIRNAVSDISTVLLWSRIPEDEHNDALKIFQKPWFRERVFDKHLWIEGVKD
jgi:hypothetical protein